MVIIGNINEFLNIFLILYQVSNKEISIFAALGFSSFSPVQIYYFRTEGNFETGSKSEVK